MAGGCEPLYSQGCKNIMARRGRVALLMVHVLLRIAVWVVILGVGYLLFGPGLFDSSAPSNPLASDAPLFLPAAKTAREIELETLLGERALDADESAEYRDLVRERQAAFWQRQGVSVEEALAGTGKGRRARLARILEERGLTREEAAVFLLVVERDRPALLADREQAP